MIEIAFPKSDGIIDLSRLQAIKVGMPTVPYTVMAVQVTAVSRMAKGPQRYGMGFAHILYCTHPVYHIQVAFRSTVIYVG